MIVLPVTLTAAAAALINFWLALRCGQTRAATGITIGDDAGGPLTRRMRAQANFIESTAFVLILIAAIELAGGGGQWLAYVSGLYFLARIAHPFGMESTANTPPLRAFGVIVTMLTQVGLAVVAVLVATGRM